MKTPSQHCPTDKVASLYICTRAGEKVPKISKMSGWILEKPEAFEAPQKWPMSTSRQRQGHTRSPLFTAWKIYSLWTIQMRMAWLYQAYVIRTVQNGLVKFSYLFVFYSSYYLPLLQSLEGSKYSAPIANNGRAYWARVVSWSSWSNSTSTKLCKLAIGQHNFPQ